MKLFLDIDGVLLNFQDAYYQYTNKLCGTNIPIGYIHDNWQPFEGTNPIMTKEECDYSWAKFCVDQENGFGNLQLLNPKIPYDLMMLRDYGHEIILITSIPLVANWNLRLQNLEDVKIGYDKIFNAPNIIDKYKIINQMKGDDNLFLDDRVDNVRNVIENCDYVDVYIMRYPYNQYYNHPCIKSVNNWDEFMNIIASKLVYSFK